MSDVIAVNDRGLAYGDGLFETIAVIDGKLKAWALHWQRLSMGAERLSIILPAEQYLLDSIASRLDASLTDCVLKIIITRGSGGRGYLYPDKAEPNIIITVHSWPERSDSDYSRGIKVVLCQTCLAKQPALAGIKHLNRLEQVLGRNEFAHTDYAEGVMLACSDHDVVMDSLLIEGTSSNLFFVINGSLMTPNLDCCGVQGTLRQSLLQHAQQLNIPVQQGYYPLSVLKNASEVFFTNSIYGIVPVASIKIDTAQLWSYNDRKIATQLALKINSALKRPAVFN